MSRPGLTPIAGPAYGLATTLGVGTQVVPVPLALPGDTARTGVKRFGCTYCELAFNRKDDALRHERKHTGEKPFKCSFCE